MGTTQVTQETLRVRYPTELSSTIFLNLTQLDFFSLLAPVFYLIDI